MIRLPPRSTPLYSSAASDVYKRQGPCRGPAGQVRCECTACQRSFHYLASSAHDLPPWFFWIVDGPAPLSETLSRRLRSRRQRSRSARYAFPHSGLVAVGNYPVHIAYKIMGRSSAAPMNPSPPIKWTTQERPGGHFVSP